MTRKKIACYFGVILMLMGVFALPCLASSNPSVTIAKGEWQLNYATYPNVTEFTRLTFDFVCDGTTYNSMVFNPSNSRLIYYKGSTATTVRNGQTWTDTKYQTITIQANATITASGTNQTAFATWLKTNLTAKPSSNLSDKTGIIVNVWDRRGTTTVYVWERLYNTSTISAGMTTLDFYVVGNKVQTSVSPTGYQIVFDDSYDQVMNTYNPPSLSKTGGAFLGLNVRKSAVNAKEWVNDTNFYSERWLVQRGTVVTVNLYMIYELTDDDFDSIVDDTVGGLNQSAGNLQEQLQNIPKFDADAVDVLGSFQFIGNAKTIIDVIVDNPHVMLLLSFGVGGAMLGFLLYGKKV